MRARLLATIVGIAALMGGAATAHAANVYVAADPFDPATGEPAFISQFAQAGDGSLVQLSPWQVEVPPGQGPNEGSNVTAFVITADGTSLYAADSFNGRVDQYDVASDGQLSLKTPPFVTAPTGPRGLALSPDDSSLYAVTEGGRIFQYDIDAHGHLTPKTPANVTFGTSGGDVGVAPDGRSAWATDYGNNGAGTTIAQFQIGSDGRLFPNTPATTTTSAGPAYVAVSPDGNSVYVPNYGLNGANTLISQYDVAPNGTLVAKSPASVNAGAGPGQPALTPDGTSAYVPLPGHTNGTTVAQFDIGAGGLLAFKNPPTVASGTDPFPAAADAAGTSVYVGDVADNAVSQYDVGAGGALSPKAMPTVFNNGVPEGLAVAPTDGPTAAFTAAVNGTTAVFDASGSGPSVARYDWDFGDGTRLDDGGPTPSHVYPGPSPYLVTLSVTDDAACGPAGVWNGHQFMCTGDDARTSQVVDIPPPGGPAGAPGANGGQGTQGPQGPQGPPGAPAADRLDVALLFTRLRATAGHSVAIPFLSSAFAGIALEIYEKGHRVARIQRFASAGRNVVRWRSGNAPSGGYRVVLNAVGIDGQRAVDQASMALLAQHSATTRR